MRPSMGGPGIQSQQQTKGQGSMGILMPIYSIGIVIFFVYTIMKLVFKNKDEEQDYGKRHQQQQYQQQLRARQYQEQQLRAQQRQTHVDHMPIIPEQLHEEQRVHLASREPVVQPVVPEKPMTQQSPNDPRKSTPNCLLQTWRHFLHLFTSCTKLGQT